MITGIDEKLKERLAVKEQEAPTPLRDAAIPVYREAAMYAFEAGELDAYRTSMQANMDCKEAIEQTINLSLIHIFGRGKPADLEVRLHPLHV